MRDNRTVIIGAGPAGSMLAHKLASHKRKVLLLDHRAPWEKPCGGMLGQRTIGAHPELKDYPYRMNSCKGITYISPGNQRKYVPSESVIPVISRLEFNSFLLDMAKDSGVEFIPVEVLNISHSGSEWALETGEGSIAADLVIGADGVKSIVRESILGRIPDEHLSLACGYLLEGLPGDQYITKYLDIEGYIYVIARPDCINAGIGARWGTVSGKSLFGKLDHFLSEHYHDYTIADKYSALIPTVTDEAFFDRPCCGENWMLIGDAAGHVDPALGEGIIYALESAKAAAAAILDGDISSYDIRWRRRYGDIMKKGASFRRNLSILAEGADPVIYGTMAYNLV